MPDRIVRAKILTSEKVDQLDPPAEVFYRRLMNVVDDFGRFDARLSILRAACFPLRIDRTREADCSRWLAACQKAGLIALYEVDAKPYLELLNLQDRRRAKHSKYPPPPAVTCQHVTTRDDTCPPMPPYSDSESHANANAKKAAGAARASPNPNPQQRVAEHYQAGWVGLYPKAGKCLLTKEHYAMLARLVKELGEDRTNKAIDRFFSDGSEFVATARHPLEIFVKRVNQYNAGDGGAKTTSALANHPGHRKYAS